MLDTADYRGGYNIRTDKDGETTVSSVPRKYPRRKPRQTTIALTDCVCYDSDGNIIRVVPRTASNRKVNRRPNSTPTVVAPRQTEWERYCATQGSNHEGVS